MHAICNKTAVTFGCKELVPIRNHQIGVPKCCLLECAIKTHSTASPIGATRRRELKIDPQHRECAYLFHHGVDCIIGIPRHWFRDHVIGSQGHNDCCCRIGELVGDDLGSNGCFTSVLRIKDHLGPDIGGLGLGAELPKIVGSKSQTVANDEQCSLTVWADGRFCSRSHWNCGGSKKKRCGCNNANFPSKRMAHRGVHSPIVAR